MKKIEIGKVYRVTRENKKIAKTERFRVLVKGIEDHGTFLYINYENVYGKGERFGEYGRFGACRLYKDDRNLAIVTKFEEVAA